MLFYTNLTNPSKKKYSYQKLFKDRICFLKCINLQGMILGLIVAANHFQISCEFEIDSCFVSPSTTMKSLPVTYSEDSWISYRTRDVDAGSAVPNVLEGTVFWATLLSQSFCIRPCMISDLESPEDIEFTLILYTPFSIAMTWYCHHHQLWYFSLNQIPEQQEKQIPIE